MNLDVPQQSAETVYRVADLNRLARQALEQRFPLIWIAGEVSNLTRATSGHVYFTLKDEYAQVRCAMFRNRAQTLPWRLENGMKVEVRALVTLYEARGDFQLNVEGMRLAGIGALYEAFTRLRDKLAAEGLFAMERKRPLPAYPRAVGIVTSLQAAALRDVLACLERRAPHLPIILYPSPVQGEGAAAQIVQALRLAGERRECDVLILTRGGGSLEDLWSFNDESVARALCACPIPVIVGVGHETDTSIADFAADRRAATPTAAAELVSAAYVEAGQRLKDLTHRLRSRLQRRLDNFGQKIDTLAYRLIPPAERLARHRLQLTHLLNRMRNGPQRQRERLVLQLQSLEERLLRQRPAISSQKEYLDLLVGRLQRAGAKLGAKKRAELDSLASQLRQLSPQAVLSRGYSITRDDGGRVIKNPSGLSLGATLHIELAEGKLTGKLTAKD